MRLPRSLRLWVRQVRPAAIHPRKLALDAVHGEAVACTAVLRSAEQEERQ